MARSSLAFAVLALGWIAGAEALAQPYDPRGAAIIARVAPDAPGYLVQADQALARRHMGLARETLEPAETSFLNARLRGERGLGGAIQAIAQARYAMDRGDVGGARGAIRPLIVASTGGAPVPLPRGPK